MHRIVFCLVQNLFSRAHDIISIVNCIYSLRCLLLEVTPTDLHLVMSAAIRCSASIVRPLVLRSLRTVAHPDSQSTDVLIEGITEDIAV